MQDTVSGHYGRESVEEMPLICAEPRVIAGYIFLVSVSVLSSVVSATAESFFAESVATFLAAPHALFAVI